MSKDLNTEFKRIEAISDAKKRGREFEVFLTKIFKKEDIIFKGRFRPKGEEIDGAIFLHGRTYLVEAKWRKDPEPASSVYEFRGKIEGKLDGTLGIFWSINGYSENCVRTVMAGKTLNVIMFDKSDLRAILDGLIDFRNLLEEKILAASRYGSIFVPWSDIRESKRVQKETEKAYPTPIVQAILEGSKDAEILISLFDYCQPGKRNKDFVLVTLPAGGKNQVLVRAPVYATTLFFSQNAYNIVMMDRDDDTDEFVNRFRNKLTQVAGPGEDRLHLAVPNPTIWSWLDLTSISDIPDLDEYLKKFDWSVAISKHSELRKLSDFIKTIK
jgi:hypothetical protein